MSDLSFTDFKEQLKDNIKRFLPEDYQDATISFIKVSKNNQLLNEIVIERPDQVLNPSIRIDGYYDNFVRGIDIEYIADKIATHRVEMEPDQPIDISQITDFEKAKSKILPQFVSTENNEVFLNEHPHWMMDDIAIAYNICMEKNDTNAVVISVQNNLLDIWGVTIEDVHKHALGNMPVLMPSKIEPVENLIKAKLRHDLMKIYNGNEEFVETILDACNFSESNLFSLSNEHKFYGATAILDDSFMENISGKYGEGFYLLPMSVNEMILVPADEETSLEELSEILLMLNDDNANETEKLSNHVYMYDVKKKELYRADRKDEHERERDGLATMKSEKKLNERSSIKEKLSEKKHDMMGQKECKKISAKHKENSL